MSILFMLIVSWNVKAQDRSNDTTPIPIRNIKIIAWDGVPKVADGGKMGTFSTVLNWYPLSNIFANVNDRYSILERFDETGKNQGLVVRLGFILD